MKLRRYCVTVMDNWTPMREFWTLTGALTWRASFVGGAYLYKWQNGRWCEIGLSLSRHR